MGYEKEAYGNDKEVEEKSVRRISKCFDIRKCAIVWNGG